MGLTSAQVLDEGDEGSRSGVEHAVAVQRAEDPLQTGQNLQNLLPLKSVSLQSFRLPELWFRGLLASV